MLRLSTDPTIRDAQETAEDASILKRYKIMHLIGTGNYARVYKAIFTPNNKELAIKSINLAKTSDSYKQKFLPRELSILKRLNHVNVCKIYEIIQVTDRIFIVMQYCSRGTIADLLQKNQGPFNESVTRYLFAPTVEALVYLHSLDIAHRDIKIENILLDQDYVPKLTDFSYSCFLSDARSQGAPNQAEQSNKTLSRLLKSSPLHPQKLRNQQQPQVQPVQQQAQPQIQQQQQPQQQQQQSQQQRRDHSIRLNDTFCGTLPYLSPEMIRKSPYDPRKTDTWSLGVCLYVLLNDRLPFPFNDIKDMVRRQLTRDFKFRANVDVSISCHDLVERLLEPDFGKRATSLEASRHCWVSGPRERPCQR